MKNLEQIEKEELTNSIIETLAPVNNLADRLEVLANVFMIYGMEAMLSEGVALPERVTPEGVIDVVMGDIKKRGNTIGNSLARQGLTILEWLHRQE